MADTSESAAAPGIVAAVTKLVTAGTIPIADFIRAYNDSRPTAKRSPRFAVLDVESGGELEALPMAVETALRDEFFVALWESLLRRLSDAALQDPAVNDITGGIGARAAGRMQSILRVAGLRSVSTLPAILRSARATGFITAVLPGESKRSFGTGFLVTPTLLLTAAHVVDKLTEGTREKAGSADAVTVQFHNQLEAAGQWPIKCKVATSWLVSMSPPNGGGGVIANSTENASEMLDFALLKLAEPVGVITGYVDVSEPPEPLKDGRLTVIGYDGGTECLFDDHVVHQLDVGSCRVHHDANAIAGMSGGPCINSEGRAVAIHEGSMASAVPPYNRAVNLRAIRAWMKRTGVDPLQQDTGLLWGVHDANVRRAWVAAGQVGRTEQEREEWLASIAAFNPDDAINTAPEDTFHPVFGRTDLQDWARETSLPRSERRIALVSGVSGTGKSFSGWILRALLDSSRHILFAVPPAQAVGSAMMDTLNRILRDAGSMQPIAAPAATRPAAGILRRDVLPDALADMGQLVHARVGPMGLMWLMIDVGEDEALTVDVAHEWRQFLNEAERHPWLRVVMVGLSNTRRAEFASGLSTPASVFSKSLGEVTSDEFVKVVERMAEAERLSVDDWKTMSLSVWDSTVEGLSKHEGRAVQAVRVALEIRQEMRKAGGQGNG